MDKFTEMEETSAPSDDSTMTEDVLRRSIERSQDYLLARQHEKGYWVDELEANVTISAELIFFMHFTDRLDVERQKKISITCFICSEKMAVGRFFMVVCATSTLRLSLIWL